ncbi:phage holin family protein [Bacteroides salyersiae]|jgi:hypothetical protein|uniref:phage holin family protein n=1 Tax=Bacteroides salyersiae TaxID=291644 RepID=UPI001897C32C|nr:phage holin family protein [Bacteroides salyersiae]
MNYIERFLATYGFDGIKGFLLSLFPSFKYGTQVPAFSLSVLVAIISEFLGTSPLLVLVMFLAVIVETTTGRRASKKRGEPFESFKFSRCVIKVFVWCFLFFMFHSFSKDMQMHDGWVFILGVIFFDVIHVATMVYFCIEYGTSILENLAVIDGKPKETLIVAMSDVWTSLIGKFKNLKQ